MKTAVRLVSLCLLCFTKLANAERFDLENTAQSPDRKLSIALLTGANKKNYFTIDGMKSGYWKVSSNKVINQPSQANGRFSNIEAYNQASTYKHKEARNYELFLTTNNAGKEKDAPVLKFTVEADRTPQHIGSSLHSVLQANPGVLAGGMNIPGTPPSQTEQFSYNGINLEAKEPSSILEITNIIGSHVKGFFINDGGNKVEKDLNFTSKDASSKVLITNFQPWA